MQNKGFVKVFAVLLTLVCLFYLSFSFVTRHHMNKAAEDPQGEAHYLDSVQNEKVYLGVYSLKQCREMEIGLGLDLKGGMNVILEVSVPDVVKALADHKSDEAFNQAVATASKQAITSQDDFITLFVNEYKKLAPQGTLAELFATQQLKDKVNTRSTDAEVEKVLRDEVKAAIDNSYNVLRTRIDRFGVAQPNIQSLEGSMGRIMVELPGIKEPERVRKLLQGSANLEFWETYNGSEIVPTLQSVDMKLRDVLAVASGEEVAEEAATESAVSATDSLAAALKGETVNNEAALAQMKKEHPLQSVLQLGGYGAVVGIANHRDTAEVNKLLAMKEAKAILPKDLSLKWGVKAMDNAGQMFELYAIKVTERNGKAPLEGDVITDARNEYDQYNKPCVGMSMNTDGSRRWAVLTKNNIGRAIAIVLDGYVYSAPNVNGEITGGNSQISGSFTPEETLDLANVLKSGKMPAPARIVQEDIVGPSLGQESINQGIISFIVALVLLMIYMCAMYGFIPGMVANCALFVNFFFTLGILTSFQAALTMSGIAGMVLSLGMAVDANVLIYERTKEELRAGKTVKAALADGYS
ncbi:MAG: protein translocase subunit SecD, partial [Bacteroidaceae bacterium]|nr:protein translocase subunit SecD [Bacteroidaceae bacterium]